MAVEKKKKVAVDTTELDSINAMLVKLQEANAKMTAELTMLKSAIPDTANIVETVEGQLAPKIIEGINANAKAIAGQLPSLIQQQTEATFKANIEAIRQGVAKEVAKAREVPLAEESSQRGPAAETPSRPGVVDTVMLIVNGVLGAAQANPEGVKAIAAIFKPPMPPEAILLEKMGQTLKLSDTMLKMQKAVASGEDVNKVIAEYTKKA